MNMMLGSLHGHYMGRRQPQQSEILQNVSHVKAAAVQKSTLQMFKKLPNGNDLEFLAPQHSVSLMDGLNDLRHEGQFTDITLQVRGQNFTCHRAVLASCSSYFRAMFTSEMQESKDSIITLNEVNPQAMETLLSYVYTARLVISDHNVQEILEAASLFQIFPVRDACAAYLKRQLHPSNCLGFQRFAESHSCNFLRRAAEEIALMYLDEVSHHEEFILLNYEHLLEYVSHKDLIVTKEEILYEAIMKWIKHDSKRRIEHISQLLKQINFSKIKTDYFNSKILNEQLLLDLPNTQEVVSVSRQKPVRGKEVILLLSGKTGRPNLPSQFNHDVLQYDPCSKSLETISCDPDREPNSFYDSIATAAKVNDQILFIRANNAWLFDIRTLQWNKVAPPLRGTYRSETICVELGGYVYVLGGHSIEFNREVAFVERYDAKRDVWEVVSPLIRATRGAAVAACDGKIYMFCGHTEVGNIDLTQCYDPATNMWQILAPLPIETSGATAITFNDSIYLLAVKNPSVNHNNPFPVYNHVFRYDVATDTWQQMANMNEGHRRCAAIVCQGKIFAVGGTRRDFTSGNMQWATTVEMYDPNEDMWETCDQLAHPIFCHSGMKFIISDKEDIAEEDEKTDES